MNAQQLKNSILQMAVQGKLVPQDPNDEPASVLLERIRAEKEKLIKEGKIKKEKNPSYIFRGEDNLPYEKIGKNEPVCIADEVPFEIPDSWEWVRLGNIISIFGRIGFRGYTKNDMVDKGKGAITISPSNIKGMDTNFTDNSYISWAKYEESPEIMIFEDDLLLVKTGSSYGKCGIVKNLPEKATINPQLVVLKYVLINRMYLLYVLNSPIARKQYEEFVIGTSIPTFSQEKLSSLLIPLPPLEEQEKITCKIQDLNECLTKYDNAETVLNNLQYSFPEALKKSILQQAVMGKLVPQDPNDEPASILLERIRAEKQALIKSGKLKKDKHESIIYRRDNSHYEKVDNVEHCIDDEIPFDIPDNWTWTRFDAGTLYTTDYVANGSFASLRENVKTYKDPNYAIMIKTQDFANGFSHDLTYTDKAGFEFLSKSELHGGELMLSNIGASIGKAFIIPVLDCPMTLAPNAIVVKCINETMTLFIKYLMLSFYGQQVLKDFTAGTAMPKFSKTQLRNTLIPLPPIEEQKRILIQIETLFSYVDTL